MPIARGSRLRCRVECRDQTSPSLSAFQFLDNLNLHDLENRLDVVEVAVSLWFIDTGALEAIPQLRSGWMKSSRPALPLLIS